MTRKTEKEIEILDKLKELVDLMETQYGNLEGFEVKLDHPIVDGQRQAFADIEEFNILYIHRQQIEING
jgi:hypothetical protein